MFKKILLFSYVFFSSQTFLISARTEQSAFSIIPEIQKILEDLGLDVELKGVMTNPVAGQYFSIGMRFVDIADFLESLEVNFLYREKIFLLQHWAICCLEKSVLCEDIPGIKRCRGAFITDDSLPEFDDLNFHKQYFAKNKSDAFIKIAELYEKLSCETEAKLAWKNSAIFFEGAADDLANCPNLCGMGPAAAFDNITKAKERLKVLSS